MKIGIYLRAGLLLGLLNVFSPAQAAGAWSGFGVSTQVVVHNQATLAHALPLPAPGRVMQESARGLSYFYEGALEDASAYYHAKMQALGYVLSQTTSTGPTAREMRWQRGNEVAMVRLQATEQLAPTRVSLVATQTL
jgi:hypothetical protein